MLRKVTSNLNLVIIWDGVACDRYINLLTIWDVAVCNRYLINLKTIFDIIACDLLIRGKQCRHDVDSISYKIAMSTTTLSLRILQGTLTILEGLLTNLPRLPLLFSLWVYYEGPVEDGLLLIWSAHFCLLCQQCNQFSFYISLHIFCFGKLPKIYMPPPPPPTYSYLDFQQHQTV